MCVAWLQICSVPLCARLPMKGSDRGWILGRSEDKIFTSVRVFNPSVFSLLRVMTGGVSLLKAMPADCVAYRLLTWVSVYICCSIAHLNAGKTVSTHHVGHLCFAEISEIFRDDKRCSLWWHFFTQSQSKTIKCGKCLKFPWRFKKMNRIKTEK